MRVDFLCKERFSGFSGCNFSILSHPLGYNICVVPFAVLWLLIGPQGVDVLVEHLRQRIECGHIFVIDLALSRDRYAVYT